MTYTIKKDMIKVNFKEDRKKRILEHYCLERSHSELYWMSKALVLELRDAAKGLEINTVIVYWISCWTVIAFATSLEDGTVGSWISFGTSVSSIVSEEQHGFKALRYLALITKVKNSIGKRKIFGRGQDRI